MGVEGSNEPPPDRGAPTASEKVEGFRARMWRYWSRHRTLLWTLHSVWALATGVVVLLLARERYDFVLWVVAFMVLTWVSTLLFGRRTAEDLIAETGTPGGSAAREVTSYLMRIMYQETLFFLLPFYAYSTVFRSANVAFLLLLGGLAVLACLDLVFDRFLRASPVFGLVFFALVAFAGLNLLLPMVLGLRPRWSTPLAAALAVGAAFPLALHGGHAKGWVRVRLAAAGFVFLGVTVGAPELVPPVPLRMSSATFARGIEQGSLVLTDSLEEATPRGDVGASLVVLVRVFAPSALPTGVRLEWQRDGETLRVSRPVEIVAGEGGFRVWDRYRDPSGALPAGTYRVILRTLNGRVFGLTEVRLTP